jgi:hypothetical protein
MKRKTFLPVFILLAAAVAGIALWVNRRAYREDLPPHVIPVRVQFAANEPRTTNYTANARIEAAQVVDVAFEVSGKLEQGAFLPEPGRTFKKGELLYQVNNRAAFAAMNRDKASLSVLLLGLMPEIDAQFPAEKNKWVRFMEELKPQFLLPELPRFQSSKERYLVTEKGILTAFYALQQAEANMADYFYLAPFDGIVLSVSKHPGSIVAAYQTVARIGVSDRFFIRGAIGEEAAFGKGKTVYACLSNGDTIGKAAFAFRLVTKDDSTRFLFKPELYGRRRLTHGMPVVLKTTAGSVVKSTRVPASAVDGDFVRVLRNGKVYNRRIAVIGRENDSLFISGLSDGEAFLTGYVYHPDARAFYSGSTARR